MSRLELLRHGKPCVLCLQTMTLFFIAKESLTKRVPSGLESVFASGQQVKSNNKSKKRFTCICPASSKQIH